MKIEVANISAATYTKAESVDATQSNQETQSRLQNEPGQQRQKGNPLSKQGRETLSEKVVIEAIEDANKALEMVNKRFEFSVHEKTKEIMVKIVDSETDEVIREIPPEKILDLIAKMCEMAGILVDERG